MRPIAFILLVLASLAALGFLILDQGLSGGSATNPAYAMVFVAICAAFILALVMGRGGQAASVGGSIFAVAPLFLLLGYCSYQQSSWQNRPEAQAARALAKNVACATSKAGIAKADRPFVSARIRLIYRLGFAGGEEWPKEIEARMAIRILPGCQFRRVARVAPPPAEPSWPTKAPINYGEQP